MNLNHPLSKEIREYWNQHCIWYQIFGGSGPLDRLRARLNRLLDRRATLLRQAPTDVVREKMAKLETTKGFLEHELAFMEVSIRFCGAVTGNSPKLTYVLPHSGWVHRSAAELLLARV